MHRITISVPDALAEILAAEAHRRRTSVSGLVRGLVEGGLGLGVEREVPFAGLICDEGLAPAYRIEEQLSGFGDDDDRDRR